MDMHSFVADLNRRDIRLVPDGDSLIVEPASKLTHEDRQIIRAHKSQILALLAVQVPLDLEAITDAISAQARSPLLNDLALSRAARAAVEASRIIRTLPDSIRREALSLRADISRNATQAIHDGDYRRAYQALDALPGRLRVLIPQ